MLRACALSSTGNKQSCAHHGFPERKEPEISAASACWTLWDNHKSPDSKQNQWGKVGSQGTAGGADCCLGGLPVTVWPLFLEEDLLSHPVRCHICHQGYVGKEECVSRNAAVLCFHLNIEKSSWLVVRCFLNSTRFCSRFKTIWKLTWP